MTDLIEVPIPAAMWDAMERAMDDPANHYGSEWSFWSDGKRRVMQTRVNNDTGLYLDGFKIANRLTEEPIPFDGERFKLIRQVPLIHTLTIELDSRHAHVMILALDLYSRLLSGQFDELRQLFCYVGKFVDYAEAQELEHQLSRLYMSGVVEGIYSHRLDDSARVAWDLIKAIRHPLAWAREPNGGIGVHFDTPTKSSALPLAKVQVTGASPDPTYSKKD